MAEAGQVRDDDVVILGEGVDVALDAEGVDLGRMSVSLPPDAYRELRRRAALEDSDPGTVIAEALETDR